MKIKNRTFTYKECIMGKYKKINTVKDKKLEEWVNRQWKRLWISFAIGLVLTIFISVATAWNPVHQFFCDHQPDDTPFVLQKTASLLAEYSQIVSDSINVNETNAIPVTTLDQISADSMTKMLKIDWYPGVGKIIVWLCDTTIYGYQSYDYNLVGGGQENLQQAVGFVNSFLLTNEKLFRNQDFSRLEEKLQMSINKHAQSPLRSPCGKWHATLWFVSSFMRMFFLTFLVVTVYLRYKYYKQMVVIQNEFVSKHKFSYSQPSIYQVFKEASPVLMVENYRNLLEVETKTFRKMEQQLRRSEKKERILFEKVNGLIAKLSNEFGNSIPGKIFRQLEIVFDAKNSSLVERNNALARAESEFINLAGGDQKKLSLAKNDDLISRRNSLHKEVEQLISQVTNLEDNQPIMQYWKLYEKFREAEPDRLVKQIYYLQQALLPETNDDEVNTETREGFETPQPLKSANKSMNLADVVEQFDIHGYLPKGIPHNYVVAIVIWGLLKPGQRGTTYVNEKYLRDTNLRADSERKIGSDFDATTYNKVLTWLLDQGIVLKPKRTLGHAVYSLNPHALKATPQGTKIVNSIIAFRQVLESYLV